MRNNVTHHFVVCDQCKTQKELANEFTFVIPGWYTLRDPKTDKKLDFCSETCVSQYMEEASKLIVKEQAERAKNVTAQMEKQEIVVPDFKRAIQ